jgi:hypothetical protein
MEYDRRRPEDHVVDLISPKPVHASNYFFYGYGRHCDRAFRQGKAAQRHSTEAIITSAR